MSWPWRGSIALGTTTTTTPTRTRTPLSPSLASAESVYVEEGSRDDSMAARSPNSFVAPRPSTVSSVGVVKTSFLSSRSGATLRSSLTRSQDEHGSSSHSGSFGMSSSFNNRYEKKIGFNRGRQSSGAAAAATLSHINMLPVQEELDASATSSGNGTFRDSGTFADSSSASFHAKRVSFHNDTTTMTVVRMNSRPEPITSFHKSDELERSNVTQDSTTTFNDSASSSQFNDSVAGQSQDLSPHLPTLISSTLSKNTS